MFDILKLFWAKKGYKSSIPSPNPNYLKADQLTAQHRGAGERLGRKEKSHKCDMGSGVWSVSGVARRTGLREPLKGGHEGGAVTRTL